MWRILEEDGRADMIAMLSDMVRYIWKRCTQLAWGIYRIGSTIWICMRPTYRQGNSLSKDAKHPIRE